MALITSFSGSEAGADLECRSHLGLPPLGMAAARGAAPLVKALVDAGADTESQVPHRTAPHSPVAAGLEGLHREQPEMAGTHCVAGRRVQTDAQWATPLMLAAAAGAAGCVRVLIEDEAGLEQVDRQGLTALGHALVHAEGLARAPRAGSVECAALLLEAGAEKDGRPEAMADLDPGMSPGTQSQDTSSCKTTRLVC